MKGSQVPHVRRAAEDELPRVIEIFAVGFAADPVWGSWTFPDVVDRVPALREFWAPYVHGTARHDGVVVLDDLSAVSLWVPPGVPDLDARGEIEATVMMTQLLGERAPLVDRGWEIFAESRPVEPHWYLSLLATDPNHRGHGLGMSLVAGQLETVDEAGLPAYLESTNPGNIGRYRRAGFEPMGHFDLPEGPRVDRMWRPAV